VITFLFPANVDLRVWRRLVRPGEMLSPRRCRWSLTPFWKRNLSPP